MGKSIRYYYFTSIATVLVSSVLVMGLLQIVLSLTFFQQQKQTGLYNVVESISDAVQTGHINLEDPDSLVMVEYLADAAEASIIITNGDGHIVYATENVDINGLTQLPLIALEGITAESVYYERGTLAGSYNSKQYIIGKALTGNNGEILGVALASIKAANARPYLMDTFSSFVLAGGLVLLVSSILALILANRTVIPVRRVSQAARRFGEGDYSARAPVDGDDELAQLAVTFNEMAKSCEATDISRRAFMGNIAHELRTPMTTIKGFIDGMLDDTIPPEQREKYLGIVSEEVGRLSRLTQNMLDISKLEAGEITPKADVFDVWQPAIAVLASAEQRINEKHIEVKGLEDIQPAMVQADEDYVHQVLFNIMDNAIKFTPEGGTISLQVMPGKGSYTISVMNTGEGIAADVLPYIFDRFYKADQSRGLNAKGSGLGLHICKVLVGLMGGRIWAESVEGKWTSFQFTLPNAPVRRTTVQFSEGAVKDFTNEE